MRLKKDFDSESVTIFRDEDYLDGIEINFDDYLDIQLAFREILSHPDNFWKKK